MYATPYRASRWTVGSTPDCRSRHAVCFATATLQEPQPNYSDYLQVQFHSGSPVSDWNEW